jgi:GGDEF domain-containing protein
VRDQSGDHPDRAPLDGIDGERLARAASAAQQLCDALWESLREELRDPSEERVRELSERLAAVSSTVALLVSATAQRPPRPPGAHPETVPDASTSAADAPEGARSPGLAPSDAPRAAAPSVAADRQTSTSPAVDRRTPPAPSGPAPSRSGPSRLDSPSLAAIQPISTRAGDYTFTKLVDERELDAPPGPDVAVAPIPIQPEIEIHDVRREEGASAWVSSVGRLLARHAQDRLPFAVLLIEIVDVARLERSETPHDLHGLVAQVESALGAGMRATDGLSRETRGRYWLSAPETNGTGARMLAERLARLVRGSAIHRGVPLEVAIGIAVCPDDGTEAPALAARADLGVYSARATGRSIAHTDPPAAS